MKNRILELNQLLQEKVTPACAKKFGDFLFGEFARWYGSNKEIDTTKESKTFLLLQSFVDSGVMGKSKDKFEEAFKELKKCKSSYPDILGPPKGKTLYRGTSIPYKELIKYISVSDENVDKLSKAFNSGKHITIDKNYTYTPKSKLQSWTTRFSKSLTFGSISSDYDRSTTSITVAKKMDNKELIFNPEFMNKFRNEWEVLRLGGPISGCKLILTGAWDFHDKMKKNLEKQKLNKDI